MTNNTKDNHNSGIDVLRGLAILAVLLLHINIRVPFKETFIGGAMPTILYKIIFWSGYYGVCCFFVISGFLITTSTLNKWKSLTNVSFKGFYSMRFARIMPMLVGLIIILSVLHLTGVNDFIINPEKTSLGRVIIAAMTFHINWLEIQTASYLPGSWGVLWSLSIEEVFYLFFPIVCILARKEWIFIVAVSLFLFISPLARTVWFTGYGFEEADHNHFAYMDAIALGCIAAIVARRISFKKSSLLLFSIVGWSLFLLIIVFRRLDAVIFLSKAGLNVTVLSIGTSLILIWMQKRFESGLQKPSKYTGFLRFLGRNSYEIYLTHMFVVIVFISLYDLLKLNGEWIWALYIATIAISGIFGNFIAEYFSSPLNNFIRNKLILQKK